MFDQLNCCAEPAAHLALTRKHLFDCHREMMTCSDHGIMVGIVVDCIRYTITGGNCSCVTRRLYFLQLFGDVIFITVNYSKQDSERNLYFFPSVN